MENFLFFAVLIFFAVAGFFELVKKLISVIMNKKNDENVLLVVTVKNQEDSVEGIVRAVIWKHLSNTKGTCLPQILIVDLNSTDKTPEIAQKLSDDFAFVHSTNKDGYISALRTLIENK